MPRRNHFKRHQGTRRQPKLKKTQLKKTQKLRSSTPVATSLKPGYSPTPAKQKKKQRWAERHDVLPIAIQVFGGRYYCVGTTTDSQRGDPGGGSSTTESK